MYEAYLAGYASGKKEGDKMRRPPIEKLDQERKSGDGTISARETDKLFKYVRLLEIRVFEKNPPISQGYKFKKFIGSIYDLLGKN